MKGTLVGRWMASLAALTSLVLLLPSATSSGAISRPNIVLILSDDQSYQSVEKMPYLRSRIPPQGGWYRFDRAYINNPTCCPSRATILTGRWSHHTGVETTSGAPVFRDTDTIATRLNRAGYRTAFIGKYHLGDAVAGSPQSPTYIPPGWDKFVDHKAGSNPYYDYTLNDNGTLVTHGSAPADYSTDVLRDRALAFIDRNASSQPFLLTFAPRAPHNDWTAAPRHLRRHATEPVVHTPSFNEADVSDKPTWWQDRPPLREANIDGVRRKQWDTVLALDDAVKAIHKRIHGLGLMPNTVIVYMTDNGYSFGGHRWHGKVCAYEECSRTPLFVKYGSHGEGTIFESLVGNEDLAATFADLAGTAPPSSGDGQSFAPMLRTRTVPADWDHEVLLRGLNTGSHKPPTYWGIRTPDYKYIETVSTGEVELYDLADDPYELENVAGQLRYMAIRAEMARRLAELKGP